MHSELVTTMSTTMTTITGPTLFGPSSVASMLRTDEDNIVEIGTLTAQGQPVAVKKVQVTLYKVEWRWWWDRTEDSLAQYVAREQSTRVAEATVATNAEGRAQWTLRINYPQWGRYLVRACDEDGGHCTGSVFYIDWPSWAGKQREQSGPAASMLSLTTDKASYQVGETAVIQLPESSQGRALVTVENGSGILDARWVLPKPQNTRISVPITAAMAPNAYVAVTLVQPHEGKTNDRHIRLYGVIPLEVADPGTHVRPVLEAADEWRPESKVSVKVREADRQRYERDKAKRRAAMDAYAAEHPDVVRMHKQAWDERNPEKRVAVNAVNNALRDGRLVKATVSMGMEVLIEYSEWGKKVDIKAPPSSEITTIG